MNLRAPAIPLITVDPYFSVWSPNEVINFTPTEFWSGKQNSILGVVYIDGERYTFLGYHKDYHKLTQTSITYDAFSTTVCFKNEKICLKAVFTSPLLPDDYNLLTRPVSYLEIFWDTNDGKEHTVKIDVAVSEELCLQKPWQNEVKEEETPLADGLKGIRMGNIEQKPLHESGDDICIDWGYVHLAVKGYNSTVYEDVIDGRGNIHATAEPEANEKVLFLFAYDDIESIEYFGKRLKSYWNKDGKTILQAINEAAEDYNDVYAKCCEFSAQLYKRAIKAGGEKYAHILMLAWRQVMAAHKLVLDENGEILFISKECWSNGCAATVDVSYPSTPMFLLYNPELVKGMLRPIYKYALSDAWKFDFAPHDAGQYPLVNGQVYGENQLKYQMPVEECGNMLIMETNIALATKDASFAKMHLGILEKWCKYLIEYGADPGNQLCTDDFAGHLAHNCNLSLKAIMGLQGMSIIMELLGNSEKSAYYRDEAVKMAEQWKKTAINPDGTTRLTFDSDKGFSMKYNMVWDKIWKTGLFTQEFMDNELQNNKKHFNKYGMPLDSRADYTKSDWLVWVGSMASSKELFEEFITPLWDTYNESSSRAPLTDWYDTKSGRMVGFRHRTVQGGLFIRLLMEN